MNPGSNTDLLKTRDAILKAQVPIVLKTGEVSVKGHAAETGTFMDNSKISSITITFDMQKIYNSTSTLASDKFNVDIKLTTYIDPNNPELGINIQGETRTLRSPTPHNIKMHELGHVYYNLTNSYSEKMSEKKAQEFEYNSYD